MKTLSMIVLAAALAVSPACKKKEDTAAKTGSGSAVIPGPGSSEAGSALADNGSAAATANAGIDAGTDTGSAAASAEDPNADYFKVYTAHAKPKPNDPVEIRFEKFKVTKADFDPKKIEGGKATIEVDAASIKSDSDKRDEHLRSAEYMDTGKFTNFTVDIDKVKKKDDKNYNAEATVKWRGVETKYPVTFEVLETTDDSVRIRGEHKFPRKDFKVGGDPDKSVADEITVKLQMTLKKTT